MKKITFLLFLIISINTICAQEVKNNHHSSWNSIIPKINLTEQWHFTSEFHFRRTNFLTDWEQFIVRPSIHYKPSNAYDFAIGYSYIQNYTYSDFRIPINANEHNVWQEITLKHESEKLKFDHRFRLEERFIDKIIQSLTGTYTIDGTNYNNRFRYRLTLTRPIIKIEEEKFIFIKIFDEFFRFFAKSYGLMIS